MIIDSYEFGRIVVNGKEYHSDIILFGDKTQPGWWRKEGHRLCLDDLKTILDYKPDILIIGQGTSSVMSVPEEVIQALKEKNIEVIPLDTPQAVKEYNKLHGKKKIAAAFHLTC